MTILSDVATLHHSMMANPSHRNATVVAERLFMGTETNNNNEVYVHFGRVVLVSPGTTQYMFPSHAKRLAKELLETATLVEQGRHPGTRYIREGVARNVSDNKTKRILL